MYRIRHKPTGGFVQKASAMSWTATVINVCLLGHQDPSPYKLSWAITTRGKGYVYNTKVGAEKFLLWLNSAIRDQFEIVEYKETTNGSH